MRQEIVRLKGQMEEYAGHLDHLCRNLEVINDAIFNAKEIAECLLDDDPFGAWEVIKRSQQAVEATTGDGGEGDWEPDSFESRYENAK
jgi:hypothetical protein